MIKKVRNGQKNNRQKERISLRMEKQRQGKRIADDKDNGKIYVENVVTELY